MTFLNRTTTGGESSHALLVERGNPTIIKSRKYRPIDEEDEEDRSAEIGYAFSIQPNSSITRTTAYTTAIIRNEQNESYSAASMNESKQQYVKKKSTDSSAPPSLSPLSSPSSSSFSSSWSSSLASSHPLPYLPQPPPLHHHQQEHQQRQASQQPKKQNQEQQHQQHQEQSDSFSSFSSPPHNAASVQTTTTTTTSSDIGKRLDESVALAVTTKTAKQQVNRSADLVPLTHEYDKMKRRLRTLIASTKQYHDAMARMHRARMEVVVRLAAVSSNTPIHEKVVGGNNNNTSNNSSMNQPPPTSIASSSAASSFASAASPPDSSLASIHKSAFMQCRLDAGEYQQSIVDYVVDWERAISTRVDASLDQVHGLQQKLHHYQQKVGNLRKRVHGIENSSSGSGGSIMGNAASQLLSGVTRGKHHINTTSSSGIPVKLEEKLERNQQKLEQAWKEHESAASMLCHLLEQVTHKGWKELAPLLDKAMEWECDRAMHDYTVFMRLSSLRKETNELVQRLENGELYFDTTSFINNSNIGVGAVQARSGSGRGSLLDIPVMVTSDNDENEDTASSDSYRQFCPDDEAGSIDSPPRSLSRSTTGMHPARPSLIEESPTSFFNQETMSNMTFSSSLRNNNVKQASYSSNVVETIE